MFVDGRRTLRARKVSQQMAVVDESSRQQVTGCHACNDATICLTACPHGAHSNVSRGEVMSWMPQVKTDCSPWSSNLTLPWSSAGVLPRLPRPDWMRSRMTTMLGMCSQVDGKRAVGALVCPGHGIRQLLLFIAGRPSCLPRPLARAVAMPSWCL